MAEIVSTIYRAVQYYVYCILFKPRLQAIRFGTRILFLKAIMQCTSKF